MRSDAYGLPVIYSDKNAASQQVINEETGLIYNDYSIDDLVVQIKKCVETDRIREISERVFSESDAEKCGAEKNISSLLSMFTC